MTTHILELKLKSGLLSSLQSDTIYGHFCWRLKEQLGDNRLTDFIALYQSRKPVFTLSDGLLKVGDEIQFPRPFIFQQYEKAETKEAKIISFVKNKENKKRTFLQLAEFNTFLSSGCVELSEVKEKEKQKSSKPPIQESLRVSVQIDRNSFTSSEGNLYSYNPKYTRADVSFVVLIKKHDENAFVSFKCEDLLRETFLLGFGKKKSSGYGQFEVIGDLKEYTDIKEPENPNAFMVLGNYLPDMQDALTPIGYDINTKYGKFGEELALSANPFKNPIVLLTAGSCFKTNTISSFYGRITNKEEISKTHKEAVQFGMPFSLNFHSNQV